MSEGRGEHVWLEMNQQGKSAGSAIRPVEISGSWVWGGGGESEGGDEATWQEC